MNRKLLAMACIAALASAVTALAADEKAPRLNVLFLIADDLNKTLGCYGHPTVQSPNVDRLAARAVRFEHAYCQYPVCSPSRVSMLSGRRPEHTGMYVNAGPSRTPQLSDAVFLPQHFRVNGYFTARVGKVFHIGRDVPECWDVTEEWTLENRIIPQPQEMNRLSLAESVLASGKLEGGAGEGADWAALSAPEERLIDNRIATRTAELLAQGAHGGKPFFIACGFRRPHLPHIAPRKYFDAYPDARVPLPERSPVRHPAIRQPPSEAETRAAMRGYLACVSFMDAQLGSVLEAMDRLALWQNTVVILIGDHGYHLGSRGGWWGKNTGYDEACSTAMLVAAPGHARGAVCARVVEFLDLYPTLNELCGLPAPAGLEGRSLRPLLAEPNQPWEHAAFSIVASQGRPQTLAVSTGRYRLIESAVAPAGPELHDLQVDPREWVNLAGRPEHQAALERLQQLAREHRAKFWPRESR